MGVDDLYEQLILLCEVRGELSPEGNTRVEERILEIKTQIENLENA